MTLYSLFLVVADYYVFSLFNFFVRINVIICLAKRGLHVILTTAIGPITEGVETTTTVSDTQNLIGIQWLQQIDTQSSFQIHVLLTLTP